MRPDLALVAFALLVVAGCSAGELTVSDARIRDLIPGQDKTVAYLTLTNPGAEPRVLVGAETDAARTVEIHTTRRDGDVMRMRRLSRVEIPGHGEVRFEPGGHHLMLFGVRSLDERVEIRLIFEDDTVRTAVFERVAIGGG